MLAVARPRPGVRFETVPATVGDALPRMDIAVFVGFAASGPLHTPVAVEDVGELTRIFGEDAPLGWDAERNERVYAHLVPAVRAFFRNGGRRCWVVRVAGHAQYNQFPIPGVAALRDGILAPAFARARSAGSWSDGLRLGASVQSRAIEVIGVPQPDTVDVAVSSLRTIAPGDLLRVRCADGIVLLLSAATVAVAPLDSPLSDRIPLRVTAGAAVWLQVQVPSAAAGDGAAQARIFTRQQRVPDAADTEDALSAAQLAGESAAVLAIRGAPPPAQASRDGAVHGATYELDLAIDFAAAPAPGALVQIDKAGCQLWLAVSAVSAQHEPSAPEHVRIVGEGFWVTPQPPLPLADDIAGGELLELELWVEQPDGERQRDGTLGFAPQHGRFWADLPTDDDLYAQPSFVAAGGDQPLVDADLRFPIAGVAAADTVFLPLFVPTLPDAFLGPMRRSGTRLERDGLDAFSAELFLDRDLVRAQLNTIMADADFLRYSGPSPRPLTGIHAALAVEEATLLAVPDAIHRGWIPAPWPDALQPLPSAPLARPSWWHFRPCDPVTQIDLITEPPRGNFLDCTIRRIAPPDLRRIGGATETGTFTLAWSTEADAVYVLEEATRPDFSDAATLWSGAETSFTLYGRTQGEYYYRVRAEVAAQSSDWSAGLLVQVRATSDWQLRPISDFDNATVLGVHRAMLRMAAARADLLAVVSLPEHFQEPDALTYIADLSTLTVRSDAVPPLGSGEARSLSYGALYHPWLIGPEPDDIGAMRRRPPDGAACGILARRALTRGAWIAPANERFRGVVALTPFLGQRQRTGLQTAGLNLISQEPRGFLCLSADTLADDDGVDLRPINVRRLLIVLRRLATRLGATYVFEPHDGAFRRLVQRGFESLLDQLFVRGAFAGATPASSYQVVTSSDLNTPQSTDAGRFIVELRVAPSLPMTFLTVRLLQSDAGGVVTEER